MLTWRVSSIGVSSNQSTRLLEGAIGAAHGEGVLADQAADLDVSPPPRALST